MKVQVIKKPNPRTEMLAEVFPNNDLRYVTKTVTLTPEEFVKLYNNTDGEEEFGNQYSNMDRDDYMAFYRDAKLVTENNVYGEPRTYWKRDGSCLGTNIVTFFEAGWSNHYQYTGGGGRQSCKRSPVPKDWGVLMIKRWWYRDKPRKDFGFYPAARRHPDGSITVYKTIRWW